MAHCHRAAGAVCSGSSTERYGRRRHTCARGSWQHANSRALRLSDGGGSPALVLPAVLAAEHTRHARLRRCRARQSVAAAFALADRAQVSFSEKQQTGAADGSQLSHLEGLLRVIGVGPRGAAAVERLLGDGRLRGADLWVVDENRHAVPGAACVMLHPDKPLAAEELRRVVGEGAADADGKGNINAGDGGVAFLLASAGALPGACDATLALARQLRATGQFTVVAVTRPFGFEGTRRLAAADKMIAELESIAQLVVVVEQDVLQRSFGGAAMTVAEATLIADAALEATVRTVLDALLASEILKSTRGALIWHGKDLRHYRRLLSPPLQRLLTCPGTAALGRGVASMPLAAARRMGTGQALMHLASDAVRAAAESPFLETAIGRASAVLCCLSLPPTAHDGSQDNAGGRSAHDAERHTARMTVQAGAGALISMTAGACDDIVLCWQPRQPGEHPADANSDNLMVEASALVLQLPEGVVLPAPTATSIRSSSMFMGTVGPKTSQTAGSGPTAGGQVPRRTGSEWKAMSALAGGAAAARSQAEPVAPPQPQKEARASRSTPTTAAAFFSGAAGKHRSPAHAAEQRRGPGSARQTASGGGRSAAAARGAAPVVDEDSVAVGGEQDGSVGQFLVESLTAQSLDLPPQAAKWRQEQRGGSRRRRQLIVWDATDASEQAGDGRARPAVDVRNRLSEVLQADRSESWDDI